MRVVETSRYLNNPLIFPVVNRNLLDKILREYYINYVVQMIDRGIGKVEYTWHPQYYPHRRKNKGNIYAALPGVEWARCGRDTCLFCPEIYNKKTKRYTGDCNVSIWPRYEKERDAVLSVRRKAREKLDVEISKNGEGISIEKRRMLEAIEIKEKLVGVRGRYNVGLITWELGCNRMTATSIKAVLDKHYPVGMIET